MDREKMILIAEQDLEKAENLLFSTITRIGATDEEISNSFDRLEYEKAVYEMLTNVK